MDQENKQNIGNSGTDLQAELNENQQYTKDEIYQTYVDAMEAADLIIDLNSKIESNIISSFDEGAR